MTYTVVQWRLTRERNVHTTVVPDGNNYADWIAAGQGYESEDIVIVKVEGEDA